MTDHRENGRSPYVLFITSMLIFGTIGLLRRFIPLPSAMIACIRGIVGGAVLLLFLLAKRDKHRIKTRTSAVAGLCAVGAAMGFNWILLFEAYNYTTVATATLCYYMQPTIVVLLSPIFFREKLTKRKILLCLIAGAGMVLVSGVTEGNSAGGNIKGAALGLAAAVLYAAVVIFNKKITGVDPLKKTIIQLFSAGVVMIPYLLITGEYRVGPIGPETAVLLLTAGVVHTGIAYILYFSSLPGLPAQTAAIFSYIDPVSALVFSAVFLGERLSIQGIAGAVMIIGAAAAYAFPEKRNGCSTTCQGSEDPL